VRASSLRRRLELLGRARSFRLLFLATLGSGLGTWLAYVALTVDVFERTDSGSWVAALLIADFLPLIAVGFLLGPLVDRLSRKRLMIASDVVRFGVFCLLPFANSAAMIVVSFGRRCTQGSRTSSTSVISRAPTRCCSRSRT
jgi:MFS family permease